MGDFVEIRQGFLCPFCLLDLGDVSHLQAHVIEAHGERSDKDDVLVHVKGIFGRAKQRFLQFDANFALDSGIALSAPSLNEPTRSAEFDIPQEIGKITRHMDYFRSVRDSRVNQVAVDTNKLIIRLDKLVSDCPEDPTKRRAFERQTVPWASDSDASHCRVCGGKFSLARRKHHCRLCGKVICHSCSQFLTFVIARKLTNPAFAAEHQQESLTSSGSKKDAQSTSSSSPVRNVKQKTEKLLSATLSLMKRDGSEEGEDHLRICAACKGLLDRRDQMMDQRATPPLVVQMYDRLRSLMTDAANVYPSYCRMAESLNDGESMYSLESAGDLRVKLGRLQEQIDFVSKKVAQVGADANDSTKAPSPREQLLQRNVRSFAADFLREMLLYMPTLPSPDDYKTLQNEHKARLKRRIEDERAQATTAIKGAALHSTASEARPAAAMKSSVSFGNDRLVEGWTPDPSNLQPIFHYNPFEEEEPIDPLQQQILIIKGYLKQAAEAGRIEEVALLEQNLRELETELKSRQLSTPRASVTSDSLPLA
uniref:FYVE-type domain-containing protein n=1 Tax=Plectus sambesii TaxID=2011161 RepID=A0A914UUN0_9BILA